MRPATSGAVASRADRRGAAATTGTIHHTAVPRADVARREIILIIYEPFERGATDRRVGQQLQLALGAVRAEAVAAVDNDAVFTIPDLTHPNPG